jgi:hypothetical protein
VVGLLRLSSGLTLSSFDVGFPGDPGKPSLLGRNFACEVTVSPVIR